MRWNGNSGGGGAGACSSLSDSLHAVNESRRRGGNSAAAGSSWSVESSEEHEEGDVGYRDRDMIPLYLPLIGVAIMAYGERSLCNGAIRVPHC
jgi:hypothetical protein